MDKEHWQNRAKDAGLSQKLLARLLGFAEYTVSRQLRGQWKGGVPKHVQFAIVVWERLSPEQKTIVRKWSDDMDASKTTPPSA